MRTFGQVLTWLQAGAWTILGLAAVNVWRRHRDVSSRWLALTFLTLAAVVVVSLFFPAGTRTPPDWIVKILLEAIVAFPYLLYRFVASFVPPKRWAWNTVHVLTGVMAVGVLVLPRFPQPGAPRPAWVLAFTAGFVAQWGFTLFRVAQVLWQAARNQPAVARRRMLTMGLGAIGLASLIVVSAFSPSSQIHPTVFQLCSQVISLFLSPFFLFGFAPPSIVRQMWRRREDAAVRAMEIRLGETLMRPEIASVYLPAVVNLLGGRSAALIGADGEVIGTHNVTPAEVAAAGWELSTDAPLYESFALPGARAIHLENGWLVVTISPFTPFFGSDELQMLSASAVVADLALGRARLFALERQAREAMQDFVAIASHDLRTPVTVIQGFTALLRDDNNRFEDEQRREFMDAIDRQAKHLDRLIGDLLTISKLDVDGVAAARERFRLGELAQRTIDDVAADASIEVRTTGDSAVFADSEHVVRMVQNYVRNALIHGAAPISVDVERSNGSVVLRVRDAGSGVPEEFVPRLFERFARAGRKRSSSVQGTGLGLSIVRGLARANGGDAWYERNEPHGSCFAFRLPFQTDDDEGVSIRDP